MESIIVMLISALMIVESVGRADAIGDNGRAVGVLQIHPECVQDINRFAKTNYTLSDRADARKSVEMCRRYLYHYGNKYKRDKGVEPTSEVLARIWNGGPRGYNNGRTLRYWAKVRAELRRQGQARADRLKHSSNRRVVTHNARQVKRTYYRKRK